VTRLLNAGYATARKIVVAVIGATVVSIGVVMIVLPGPAFLFIPAGLAILAIEFAWARRRLEQFQEGGSRIWNTLRGSAPTKAP
jgi:uncharacterized protein (TIGR02611 family)